MKGSHGKDYKAYAANPSSMAAWRSLAAEQTPAFVAIFGRLLDNIMEQRPETLVQFLKWLLPREHILTPCIEADLASRALQESSQAALRFLKDPLRRVHRALYMSLLDRGSFLYK